MKVLFICKGNWFRSQIAVSIYNKQTNSTDAISAGTYTGAPDEPEGQVLADLFKNSPYFFNVMDEHGLDVRKNKTCRLTPEMLNQSDIVVSMAEEPYIPEFLKNDKRVVIWDIENPKGVTREIAEDTYNKLKILIKNLIKEKIKEQFPNDYPAYRAGKQAFLDETERLTHEWMKSEVRNL